MGLLATASVAIDGSKFKPVNNRDRNFTRAKVERRRAQLEESVARYLSQLDTADRQEPSETLATKTTRLKEKLAKLGEEVRRLAGFEAHMLAAPDQQISLTDPDSRSMATSGRGSGVVGYNVQVAVDTEHHLIVTHEVANVGSDRSQLSRVAKQTTPGWPRRPHSDIASATARQPIDCDHFDIRIARDGIRSYRGSPIARMPLVRLFSTVLRRDEEGHRCTVTYVRKWHLCEELARQTGVRFRPS
jgi:hypothetical protein